ncbi:MAG TPA: hypothetical protein VIJ93_07450 [bacterium]
MKKLPLFLIGCFILAVGFNFVGCSSTPAPATPSAPAGLCANPSSQGFTSIGTINGPLGAGTMYAQSVTLASAETATSISIHFNTVATVGQIRFAIYTDNGSSNPKNLVVETNPQNVAPSSWNSASLPNVYLPAGIYYMALQVTNNTNVDYNPAGGSLPRVTYAYGVFPDTFPAPPPSPPTSLLSLYLITCP